MGFLPKVSIPFLVTISESTNVFFMSAEKYVLLHDARAHTYGYPSYTQHTIQGTQNIRDIDSGHRLLHIAHKSKMTCHDRRVKPIHQGRPVDVASTRQVPSSMKAH